MNENFHEQLDRRIKDADPAATSELPELHHAMLLRATKSKPRLNRRTKFVASLGTVAAAVVAVAVLSVSSFGSYSGSPLFSLRAGGTEVAGSAVSSDSKMAIWNPNTYEYVAGAGLSDQGSSGHVYQIKPIKYTTDYMNSIAEILGVEGKLNKLSYGDFAINIDELGDWSQTESNLQFSQNGYWYYTYPGAYPQYVCGSTGSDGSVTSKDDCREVPVAKTDQRAWPTKSEAIAFLKKAVAADLARFNDVEFTFVNDYAPYVQATAKVDGEATSITFSASWSEAGVLYMVQGQHVELIDRGNFNLISPKDAVKRMSDYRYTGVQLPFRFYEGAMVYGFGGGIADLSIAGAGFATKSSSEVSATVDPAPVETSVPAAVEPEPVEPGAEPGTEPVAEPSAEPTTEPETQVTEEPTPVEPTVEPIPVESLPVETSQPEPMPSPTTVTVTVTKAVKSLATVWDADGNSWLVPVWVMYTASDGGDQLLFGVIALQDGVIELPKYEEIIEGTVLY